jgi:hypothetical protein
MSEEQDAKQEALQQAITAGLASGIVEDFDMEAIQQELDNG